MIKINKDEEVLIICPNKEKRKILLELQKDITIYNIKFMDITEFKDNYFFSYDDKAIYYLMNKYKYHYDVCKVYLDNLYPIDINKEYKSDKLNFLKNLKKELIDKDLLYFNNNFKDYLKTKKIIVKNYYDLDKYLEDAINFKNIPKKVNNIEKVYKYDTMEDEINGVCLKIIDLLSKNIPLNKIYLTNISEDYLYSLKKIFNYYHIPINIKRNDSVYSTKTVKDYLITKNIKETPDKNQINKLLINALSSMSWLDESDPLYKTLLINKLKSTSLPSRKLKDAVNITNIYDEEFSDDEYVFVLGFCQDILPKMVKDEDFITDNIKEEVDLYTTDYLNTRNKKTTIEILSNIKNLYLSYMLETPFNSFYKSSLITDLNIKEVEDNIDEYKYSNLYNKIRLGSKLDNYYLYNEKSEDLKTLLTHYDIPYNTYNNNFTGIDKSSYLSYKNNYLKLSYTQINSYNECAFKYYINYVLKLNEYEDTFQAFIGSLYHEILSLFKLPNFDFEREYQNYLEKRDLSFKERILLIHLKKELLWLLDSIKKQDLLTGYIDELYEQKINIRLDKEIETVFTGSIDKIMYYKDIEDTYFSIVDYKTGTIDTKIEPMKYGLHMQLPVYLYMIHASSIFKNPIFTGIYYQNILFSYPNFTTKKSLEEEKESKLKLTGYSTDNINVLERFDPSLEKSEFIKSLSYNPEKGFSKNSKIIDEDTLYNMNEFTKNKINENADQIINAEFNINPKNYDGKNISCNFCSFKDLCFMKENNIKYLKKVNDLDFLGGDDNV